ncbi:MAG: hypothetical protein KDA65_11530, partial [Planctomycetaceae bacterium]|nr:hypothetical protein [Planctomycetaceae bacterium]
REIKELGRGGMVDVDKISARRFHLGHLNLQIRIIDENRRQLEERINLCRQAVIESDQDVKVLEKIKTRKQEEHNREQIHHENLEREEAWRAAQW